MILNTVNTRALALFFWLRSFFFCPYDIFFNNKKWFFAIFMKIITYFCTSPILKAHSQSNLFDKKCKKSFFVIEKIPQVPSSAYDLVSLKRLTRSTRDFERGPRRRGGRTWGPWSTPSTRPPSTGTTSRQTILSRLR